MRQRLGRCLYRHFQSAHVSERIYVPALQIVSHLSDGRAISVCGYVILLLTLRRRRSGLASPMTSSWIARHDLEKPRLLPA
jgi:hypothetical protein